MTSDKARLLDLALEAAHRAGRVLLDRFGEDVRGLGTKTTPTDLVSDADRASETLLVEYLQRHRPDDGVMGEEGGERPGRSGLTWVIDPLDGTINFVYGIPHWAVSVAVQDVKGAHAGVVYDPTRGETFAAVRHGGAWLNGRPIEVARDPDLATALIGTGFAYDVRLRAAQAAVAERVLGRARDLRRAGAAALDLAWVACGRLDGFFESHLEPWDRAAGALIAAEAGAVVTDLVPPFGFAPGVVAANAGLHAVLAPLVVHEKAASDPRSSVARWTS